MEAVQPTGSAYHYTVRGVRGLSVVAVWSFASFCADGLHCLKPSSTVGFRPVGQMLSQKLQYSFSNPVV